MLNSNEQKLKDFNRKSQIYANTILDQSSTFQPPKPKDNPFLQRNESAYVRTEDNPFTEQDRNVIKLLKSTGFFKDNFPSFQDTTTTTVTERVWDGLDVANLFLGIVDGGLSALPTGSAGYWCAKNSSNTRLYYTNAVSYFNQEDIANGMKAIYDGTLLFNGISVNCYYAFSTTMNTTYWNSVSSDPLVYLNVFTTNIGYIYADIFNIVTNNWQT